MKQLYLFPTLVFLVLGCSRSSEANSESSPQETQEVVEINEDGTSVSEDEVASNEEEYVPENKDGVWQIDDYAEWMLGQKIYDSFDDAPEEKRSASQIYQKLDLKGGFASVTGAYEGWHEFVIWRMADGNDLLGQMSAGCGPICSYDFEFKIVKNGEMIVEDALPVVFPIEEMNKHMEKIRNKAIEKYPEMEVGDYYMKFILPQKGTSMRVNLHIEPEELETPLFELSWDKEQFSIEKKYEEVEQLISY